MRVLLLPREHLGDYQFILLFLIQVIIKQESFIRLFVMIEFIKGDTTHKEGKNEVFHIKR